MFSKNSPNPRPGLLNPRPQNFVNVSYVNWVSPREDLKSTVIRYIESYGLSYKQTATEIRRDIKQIIEEIKKGTPHA